jgi:hypothetical protein
LSIIKTLELRNAYKALPASLEKIQPNIELFHQRFGHLSLDNIQATRKMVTGMEFKDLEKEPPYEKICEPCELRRPI